jgi:hypothetical protein
MMVVELKLPKLPDRTPAKISITVSAELNRDLQDYAEAYKLSYGTAENVADLIPFMLAAFITGDGGFRKARSGK